MKTKIGLGTALFVSTLAGPAALAQNDGTEVRSAGLSDVPAAPAGFSVQLGGGVTGFTREATRDMFGTGGYWDARAVYGTRSFIGAELAYVGSVRESSAGARQTDTPYLMGNGAEAALRVNLPLQAGDVRIAPFLFGGVGWTYYQLVNEEAASPINEGNALSLPFGAGIGGAYEHFTLDARFTYRPVFDDDLVPMASQVGDDARDHADLQNWAVGLTLGYEF